MTQQPYDDPFAIRESAPSLTFPTPGTRYVCKIVDTPTQRVATDINTGKPKTWDDGNPKMTVVTGVEVDGERRSLWADVWQKPQSLFRAIADAQQQAGQQLAIGGTLVVEYTGDEPNENPRLNPRKLYAARYSPPDAFAQSSAQSSSQPTSQAASSSAPSSEPPF